MEFNELENVQNEVATKNSNKKVKKNNKKPCDSKALII